MNNDSLIKPRILIIDDEADIRHLLTMTLLQMNIQVDSAKNCTEARELLALNHYHFCLTDLKMPDGNGLEIVKLINAQYPHLPVAVITAFGSTENAIEAMKLGAFDFLAKPIELQHLRQLVKHAFSYANSDEAESSELFFLDGSSQSITTLREQIKQIRGSQAPLVILGDKGTEKELLAKLVHRQSSRSDETAFVVDCLVEETESLEQLLFCTAQEEDNLLLKSHNGTLIITNLHEMHQGLQKKLLQVVEDKSFLDPVTQETHFIDIRLIICSDFPLETHVQSSELREDLFFRVNVVQLNIPALSSRMDDLSDLTSRILETQPDTKSISSSALKQLSQHQFQYNYRELQNILEKSAALCPDETIEDKHLQLGNGLPLSSSQNELQGLARGEMPLYDFLESVEKFEIEKALNETRWNRTEAAKKLGISFRKIRYKIDKLDIT